MALAPSMAPSTNKKHDRRMLREEIQEIFDGSIRNCFPDLVDVVFWCSRLRSVDPDLFSLKRPLDIARELIQDVKENPKSVKMLDNLHTHDVGYITFKLSSEWMVKVLDYWPLESIAMDGFWTWWRVMDGMALHNSFRLLDELVLCTLQEIGEQPDQRDTRVKQAVAAPVVAAVAAAVSSVAADTQPSVPLYYPSWEKVLKERKAAIISDIGTLFDLRPHMDSSRWTEIYEGINMHLQKAYNTNKASFKAKHWKAYPTTGTYDVEAIRRARPEDITTAEWDKDPERAFETRWQASDTQEYPSLIDTFWRTHTVDGVFPNDEDRRIYEKGFVPKCRRVDEDDKACERGKNDSKESFTVEITYSSNLFAGGKKSGGGGLLKGN
ncbi:hypothetical protein Tco_0156553 [Tanacetum coccineum]